MIRKCFIFLKIIFLRDNHYLIDDLSLCTPTLPLPPSVYLNNLCMFMTWTILDFLQREWNDVDKYCFIPAGIMHNTNNCLL